MEKIKIINIGCMCDDDYMISKSFIEDEEFDKFMQVHRKKQITKMFVTPNISSNYERTYVLKKTKKNKK